MSDIFDYDGSAYISAFSEIMERIEQIQSNETTASSKEKSLLNRFYNNLNNTRSNSRSRSKSRSRSRSKSTRKRNGAKNRNKITRVKKTVKSKY
jgi:hypothetical protein